MLFSGLMTKMIVLPSGKTIDLSTDRSRYHALRQSEVCPTSTHRKLYSLVDIIYRRIDESGNAKRGWTEYDYDFSGYTLDTVRSANEWSEDDKAALFKWCVQNDQYRRIETARRRLVDNQHQLSVKLYSSPQHLYSLLQQRLIKMSLQRATAEQWLATINNYKQFGLRDEEIQWTGLRAYLRLQSAAAKISKTKILEKLNYKNIRLELSTEQIWGTNGGLSFKEVALRMPHQAVYRAALKLDNDCLCILRYVDSYCNYRVGVVKTLNNNHRMALNKYWFALDPYGRAIPNQNTITKHKTVTNKPPLENLEQRKTKLFFENSVDAKLAADKHAREHFGMSSGARTRTQFDHLTLFGGEDYREWIVSLPDYQRIFFGAHFYDHNILLHIRTTTRIDNMGRKILFIEEVQSDWHQSGKRLGYNNNSWGRVANAPFKKEWPLLAAKLMLIQASQNGFTGIAWTKGKVQENRYMRHLPPIKQYYDATIPRALNCLAKPFNCQVETTYINTRDTWLNLEKKQDKWRVADHHGKFKTKAKYNNRDEAMAVITRHCRVIELQVHALFISDALRQQISEKGLPLFGQTFN
jgi:hypothetical protein